MSGPSDRVHFYRNLLPIAVDEGFLGRRAALATRMPLLDRSRSNKANEERPLLRRLAKVGRNRQLFGCNEKLSREI